MKHVFGIAIAFFLLGSSSALAVCPATLQLKDNAGATPNAKYSDDGSGNCMPNVVVNGSTLPTGASTSANQASQLAQETATANAAGTTADSAYTGSGTASIIAALKGIYAAAIGPIVSPQNVTPTDCSGTITTGGTAQNAFAAQTALHGFTIKNIDASAGSGEPLWVSFTTTAAANTAASYPLAAPAATTFASGESFTSPMGMGINHAVSIVGATTGHKFSCTWW